MGKRILIVDDEEDIRTMLGTVLREHYYEVNLAANALEAFEKLQQQPPDLILLDIMMPYMAGHTFIEELESRGQWPETPVIVMTGSAVDWSYAQKKLGREYALRKPVELDELLGRVQAMIGKGE